jgi:hypothetical protein
VFFNENLEKYGRAGQATDEDIYGTEIDAICMLDYYGKNTNTPLRTETIDK